MELSTQRRRLSLGALVITGALVLGGCAGTSNDTDGTTAPEGSGVTIDVLNGEITPRNTNKIAVMVQAGETYSDTVSKAEGAQAAADELGVDAEIFWSNLDPAVELSNYNTIINSGSYGALVIQPVSPQMCKLIGDDAVPNQLVVVVLGSPLCGTGEEEGEDLRAPGTVSYTDQNQLRAGARNLFEKAYEELGDGPQRVLLVFGSEGHPTVTAHDIEWEAFSAEHPDWELAGEVYTDWTTPGSFAATQNLLQAQSDATVVFSTYIDITAGIANAIDAQGLTDQISVFESSGGTDLSVDLINQGRMVGSAPTYPYNVAYAAVETAVQALSGEQPPAYVLLPIFAEFGWIDSGNVAEYQERPPV